MVKKTENDDDIEMGGTSHPIKFLSVLYTKSECLLFLNHILYISQ